MLHSALTVRKAEVSQGLVPGVRNAAGLALATSSAGQALSCFPGLGTAYSLSCQHTDPYLNSLALLVIFGYFTLQWDFKGLGDSQVLILLFKI